MAVKMGWYDVNAKWDVDGKAAEKLMSLSETAEWHELAMEVCQRTHATADEANEDMASAIRRYLESLDNVMAINVYEVPSFQPKEGA